MFVVVVIAVVVVADVVFIVVVAVVLVVIITGTIPIIFTINITIPLLKGLQLITSGEGGSQKPQK